MLYAPVVRSGMTKAEVLPVLEKLLAGWQSDGTIRHAEQNVRQSALYEMMGY